MKAEQITAQAFAISLLVMVAVTDLIILNLINY